MDIIILSCISVGSVIIGVSIIKMIFLPRVFSDCTLFLLFTMEIFILLCINTGNLLIVDNIARQIYDIPNLDTSCKKFIIFVISSMNIRLRSIFSPHRNLFFITPEWKMILCVINYSTCADKYYNIRKFINTHIFEPCCHVKSANKINK